MFTTPSSYFTRPADTTAYTAADLVANSTTAGSVTPLSFTVGMFKGRGIVRRVRLHKTTTTTTAATFNVHLFTASPTVTNGDNGALAVSSAASYLGKVAVDMSTGAFAGTASLIQFSAAAAFGFDLGNTGGGLYGLIEATAGYVPGNAEVFTVTLEIESRDF